MAKDYSTNIATAQSLITNFGRAVTFVQYNDTVTDSTKPWNGVNPTDPRATPDATLSIDAVFVVPSGIVELGLSAAQNDLLGRSEQIAIVAPGASNDLSDYDEIIDTDGTRWTIQTVQILKPASDIVLAYVGLRR